MTRFDRGWSAAFDNESVSRDALGAEHVGELSPRVVMADHAAHAHASAESMDVVHHVGGRSEEHGLFRDVHHGHRRFRRDARDVSPDVVVQHHVADHRDAGLGETVDVLWRRFDPVFAIMVLLLPASVP